MITRDLLDTDVFSCLWQRKGDVDRYSQLLGGRVPMLSFVSVAEARFGAIRAGWGPTRMIQLDEALRRYVVVPFDDAIPKLWAQLKAQAQQNGHALGSDPQTNDLWIATIAIFHNVPLLTRNLRHFVAFPALNLITI